MKENIRIMIAAGGTAGHINPAIAIAGYIVEQCPTAKILFVGRTDGMEFNLVKNAGYDFTALEVHGFQRKVNLQNIKRNIHAAYCLALSMPAANRILNDFKPDLVIGTGGYICGPIMKVAQSLNIKTVIHESNSFPGVTNRLLAKKCDVVFTVNEHATEALKVPYKTIVSGNPVRQEILLQDRAKSRAMIAASNDDLVILSFGGSLGAAKINQAVAGFMRLYNEDNKKYIHYHSTGRYGKAEFKKLSEEYGVSKNSNIHIREYIDDMPAMLAAADIVISRSGAITVSEIAAAGRASILVPSPNVSENHQYHNAMSLVEKGAAILILDKDFNENSLTDSIEELIKNRQRLKEMGIAAKGCYVHDALPKIYRHIEKLF